MATFRRDGATCPIAGEEGRCGRLRESMRTNPLLQPTETGKVSSACKYLDHQLDRQGSRVLPPVWARLSMSSWPDSPAAG